MNSFKFAIVAAASVILSSCVVVEDGPQRPRPPHRPSGPAACTLEYAPVCGARGGEMQTFANSCTARAAGFRIEHNGQCRTGNWNSSNRPSRPNQSNRPNRPDRPDWSSRPNQPATRPTPSRPSMPGRACTRDYNPVCAATGRGQVQTFPNACEAERANARIVRPGQC